MSNFKGTQKNWKRVKFDKTEFYNERNEIHFGNDGECVAEFVANDYDALLISKAPEMLEMLEQVVILFESGKLKSVHGIKDLIKEATEL